MAQVLEVKLKMSAAKMCVIILQAQLQKVGNQETARLHFLVLSDFLAVLQRFYILGGIFVNDVISKRNDQIHKSQSLAPEAHFASRTPLT